MSLKCPLSTIRINVPCRSTVCTHNQCFDALSFLQLQEQAPTWTCPVCNKVVNFEALQVDECALPNIQRAIRWKLTMCRYFNDILKSTPRDVDQVAIEPDGKWSRISERSPTSEGGRFPQGDDDDLIEIKDMPRVAAVKSEAVSSTSPLMRTPPASSREDSTSSTAPSSAGLKRSIGHVVDLTTSSDEEEEPQRPPKRQSLHPPLPSSSKADQVASISMHPRSDLAGMSSLPPKPVPGLPYSHHRLSGPM